jgi:phage-related protein
MLVNGGTEQTNPIFEIHGPGENFEVTNQTTGKSFMVDLDIAEEQTIVVNTLTRQVTRNSDSVFNHFSGDFFTLEPGENSIIFEADSADTTTKLNVIYRDAYNGL